MPKDNNGVPWPVWAFVTILTAAIGAYTAIKVAERSRSKESTEHSSPKESTKLHDPTRSISGEWAYKMVSNQGYGTHVGKLTLMIDGTSVSGTLQTWDNSKDFVKGTVSGDTLELSRDTGFDTIQYYKLTERDSILTGTFWNTGRWF